MPNFQAKTNVEVREEFQGQKADLYPVEPMQPGESVPSVDSDGNFFDYTGVTGHFVFNSRDHSWAEILRDGYFDPLMQKDGNRYHGALILSTACAGAHDPKEWATGFLRVVQVRGAKGVSAQEPTKVLVVKLA